GPRFVVAPRAEFVPKLIEATLSGAIRSGSFALTSPQRFASLVRARRGEELLNVALGRLPASLAARVGMNGLQIAVLGAAAVAALFLGFMDFSALEGVSSGMLWLIFYEYFKLRSMPEITNRTEIH